MARPVGADASLTRKRILRAATRLFTQQGRAGTSMRAIARRAKVSLATLHHYHGSKQALYDDCVDGMYSEVAKLQDELREIIEGQALSPAEIVTTSIRRAYRFACAHRQAVRLTTRDAIEAGELSPERQQDLLLPSLDVGVALLAQLTGLTELELRLGLRSVNYLVVRYALTSHAELALVCGQDPATPEAELQEAVEAHLVRLSLLLVGLPGATP